MRKVLEMGVKAAAAFVSSARLFTTTTASQLFVRLPAATSE